MNYRNSIMSKINPLSYWRRCVIAITLVSAFIAHTSVDGVRTAIAPLVFLGVLFVPHMFSFGYEKIF